MQSYAGGAPPAVSGSPFENTCAQSTCHTGTSVTTIAGWIETNIPNEGFELDSSYTVTVSSVHIGAAKFGFCFSPQNAFGSQIGELLSINGTQLRGGGKYITHISSSINSVDSSSWSFTWQAPSAAIDSVIFYCAFNAANGNDAVSGDVIYKSSISVKSKSSMNGVGSFDNENQKIWYSAISKTLISNGTALFSSVTIMNVAGKVVTQKNGIDVDLSPLPTGLYFAVLTSSESKKQSIYKFIKTN